MKNKEDIYEEKNIQQIKPLLLNGESEYIRYATVSLLKEGDRKRYDSDNMGKSKVVCKICGITYHTNISKTCPLCELKNIFLDALEKNYLINNEIKNANIDSVEKDNWENGNSVEKEIKKTHDYKYGDTVKFGSYGGIPIEWLVIRVEENKIMIISKEGLCSMAYHLTREPVTWETSSVRRYLNSEFIEIYFDMCERKSILQIHIQNEKNIFCNTSGGNDTYDQVLLLSIDEADKILDGERMCIASDNAKINGAYVDKNSGMSWWWLRSPGQENKYAAYVGSNGAIVKGGNFVDSVRGIIRPSMWVDSNELSKFNDRMKNEEVVHKGDVITFGTYKGEEINWLVLKVNKNKLLLLSEKVLDFIPFNADDKYATWETSSLRKYLNGEFLKTAFGDEEKLKIEQVTIKNKDNMKYGTKGGNDTTDSVFCLGVDEADYYFNGDFERIAFATEFARKKMGEDKEYYINSETGGVQWWLRSPGSSIGTAACVIGSGWIYDMGHFMTHRIIGIRPALWINNE